MTESNTQAFHLVDTLEKLIDKANKENKVFQVRHEGTPANRIRQRPESQQNMRQKANTFFASQLEKMAPVKETNKESTKVVKDEKSGKRRIEEVAKKLNITFTTPKKDEGFLKGKLRLNLAPTEEVSGKLRLTKEMGDTLKENALSTEMDIEQARVLPNEPKKNEQVVEKVVENKKQPVPEKPKQEKQPIKQAPKEVKPTPEPPKEEKGEEMENNQVQDAPVAIDGTGIDMQEIKRAIQENKKLAQQIVEDRAKKDANAKKIAKTDENIQGDTEAVSKLDQSVIATKARLEESLKQLNISMEVLRNTKDSLHAEIEGQEAELARKQEEAKKIAEEKAARQAELSKLSSKLNDVNAANRTVSDLISQVTNQQRAVEQQTESDTYVAFDPRAVIDMQGMSAQPQQVQPAVQQVPTDQPTKSPSSTVTIHPAAVNMMENMASQRDVQQIPETEPSRVR